MIFNMKISGECLRNDERLLEGTRGPVIVWHGGTN